MRREVKRETVHVGTAEGRSSEKAEQREARLETGQVRMLKLVPLRRVTRSKTGNRPSTLC